MKAMLNEWTTYRTRCLICAKQLDQPLTFVDCIGREHSGEPGDYLVLSSDGSRRIAPREIFEDIYVPLDQPAGPWPLAVQLASLLPSEPTSAFGESDQMVCRELKSVSPQCLPTPSLRGGKAVRRSSAGRATAS